MEREHLANTKYDASSDPAYSRCCVEEVDKAPLYSVVVPIHKCDSSLLKSCLRSIEAQTETNFEAILVINEAGETSRILTTDLRFKHFYINPCGPGQARNFGMSKAKGLYVVFVDSDDLIDSDFLESMNEWTTKGFDVIRNLDRPCSSSTFSPPLILGQSEFVSYIWSYVDKSQVVPGKYCSPVHVWGGAFRLEFLRQHQDIVFPNERMIGEDYVFMCRVSRWASNCVIDTRYLGYHYVNNSESITHDSTYETDNLPLFYKSVIFAAEMNKNLSRGVVDSIPTFIVHHALDWFTYRHANSLSRKEASNFVNKIFAENGFFRAEYGQKPYRKTGARSIIDALCISLAKGAYTKSTSLVFHYVRGSIIPRVYYKSKRVFLRKPFVFLKSRPSKGRFKRRFIIAQQDK